MLWSGCLLFLILIMGFSAAPAGSPELLRMSGNDRIDLSEHRQRLLLHAARFRRTAEQLEGSAGRQAEAAAEMGAYGRALPGGQEVVQGEAQRYFPRFGLQPVAYEREAGSGAPRHADRATVTSTARLGPNSEDISPRFDAAAGTSGGVNPPVRQELRAPQLGEDVAMVSRNDEPQRRQAALRHHFGMVTANLVSAMRRNPTNGDRLLHAGHPLGDVASTPPSSPDMSVLAESLQGSPAGEAALMKSRVHAAHSTGALAAQARARQAPTAPRLKAAPSAQQARSPLREAEGAAALERAKRRSVPAMQENGRSVLGAASDPAGMIRRPGRPIVPAPEALLDPVIEASRERLVITMPARPGQAVAAAGRARVVFGGDFADYGPLLILEHEDDYHTILWGFAEIKVATDDAVQAGDVVGFMSFGEPSALRVEFRRNGRPVGGGPWLAASSSKVRG